MTDSADAPSTPAPARASTRPTLGARLFLGFLIVAVLGLSVLVVLLSRENERLHRELGAANRLLEQRVLAGALEPGEQVERLALIDASGGEAPLDFGPAQPPTLLLLITKACGACEDTIPVWENVLADQWPGVRVVCVQTRTADPEEAAAVSTFFECHLVQPGAEKWLRRIPVAPAAVLLSGDGRVLRTWYGHMSASQSTELQAALADVTAAS